MGEKSISLNDRVDNVSDFCATLVNSIILNRCLAPAVHDEWVLIANQLGAYTFIMYVAMVTRDESGFLVPTYSLSARLAVVSHLMCIILPGPRFARSKSRF